MAPARRTLVDRAVALLREEILAGDAAPGSRVRIEEAAARLQMSQIPIREALRCLSSEGLVLALPQRGFRVAPLALDDFEDLFRLRRTLDLHAVERAVPRLSAADLTRMDEELARLGEAQRHRDWRAQRHHHQAFHFAIFEAGASPRLLAMLRMLWDQSERYLRLGEIHRRHPERVGAEHLVLLEACRRGDVDAVLAATAEHLELTRRTVVEVLTTPQEKEMSA
ncbi:MAG TPA: GntR family transcriptional regulator [Candidatus Dormibacteraeota bacterium]|jgi:DNA-binding GntR family transcriptional regulator|nr:GntR family transcriptional regulator [Candidatus Dormibacteraeota bacterium]